MLLYDKILSEAKNPFSDYLRKCEVIVINNVAHYYFETSDKEMWDYDDFPNCAPPFQNYYMEYITPRLVNSDGKIHTAADHGTRKGMIFSYAWSDDVNIWQACAFPVFEYTTRYGVDNIIESCALFPALFMFSVDRYGKIDKDSFVVEYKDEITKSCFGIIGTTMLDVFLLATSFMHCKNVVVRTQSQPRKVIKKAKRKRKIDITPRYHLLDIEPMKRVLRSNGKIEKTGLKMALHICRGHFKDYREGNGLFGKIHGTFWWEDCVRGNSDYGAIVKEYNIRGTNAISN